VIGEEFRSRPDTVVEVAVKQGESQAYAEINQSQIEKAKQRGDTPFGGLNAHSHLAHVSGPSFMDRPGERLNVPDRLQVEIKPLSLIETKMRLRQMLGYPVTPEQNKMLRELYPDGVMEDQLKEVMNILEGKVNTAPRLVAVG
jgi:hypothetical protein